MNKLFTLFFIVVLSILSAKEPTLAILQNINSTSLQKFSIANSNFYCEAYGVLSIDKLASNKSINPTCKKSISSFYQRHPQSKYFSQEVLKVLQMYHIEVKGDRCIVFAQGEVTLSEQLLREGLALLEPSFRDDEYEGLFKTAQLNAKVNKKGLWSESIVRDCITEIYKK